MLYTYCLAGLMAGTAVSMPANYALPADVELAAGCTAMPGEFTVSGFTTYTDPYNRTIFHFDYSDEETGIETRCTRNLTSKPSSTTPSLASRYPCDNRNVEFIYQTNTGIQGLTVIEAACPDSGSSNFEASALVPFTLSCRQSPMGKRCDSDPARVSRNFTSLQPRPVGAFQQT